MSNRMKRALLASLLVASLTAAFFAGCGISISSQTDLGTPDTRKSSDIVYDSKLGQEVFDQVWDIIQSEYVEKDKLDSENLTEGAIRGLIEALDDPYTAYLPARAFELSMSDIEGKFEGIGAYLGYKNEKVVIIAPLADSPADRAGIKPGDAILEIDGISAATMSIDEIVLRVRGPKGTTVRLLILHEGEDEPVLIEIIRDEIQLSSVYSEMRGDIAYIHIMSFTERTNDELGIILEDIEHQGATGIVLDLRSNPGGLLNAVIDVSSRFIDEGIILYVQDNQGKRVTYTSQEESYVTSLPVVALTDNYTASASEVLAGALQDHGRATIAGAVTFGKGSVNTLYDLKDGSGLKITSARWLTPDGRLIEGKGIEPDFTLSRDEDAVQWAIDYLENGG